MKTSKKIWVGLAAITFFVTLFFAIVGHSLAASVTQAQATSGKNFIFVDGAHITGDFDGIGTVTFTDRDPTDSDRNFAPDSNIGFCDYGDKANVVSNPDKLVRNKKMGINIDPTASLDAKSQNDVKPLNVRAQINLGFPTPTKGCQGVVYSIEITNPNALGATDFQWDGNIITDLSGVGTDEYVNSATAPTLYLNNPSSGCADSAILLDYPSANSGKYYKFNTDAGAGTSNIPTDYRALNDKSFGFSDSCSVTGGSFKYVTLAGSQGTAAPNSVGRATANGQIDTASACVSKPDFSLNWFVCPVIAAIDHVINGVNTLIDGQLNFDTGKFLNDNVKAAWAVFRTLASSLIIILLLIMVFSQAVGGGGFLDAYTIRKLMPRLIFAVIFMQISWDAAKWIINLANDAGYGVYNLIAAPFGGSKQLTLEYLIGQLGTAAPGGTLIGAMLATTGIAIFNPFLILLFAFSIFMAVMTGLATLLFRQLLIIACVILMPFALLLWVLPSTQKYFKMWYDNFSKALMLFPIIAALIVTGRVFAWIAGSPKSGLSGTFDWLAVLFGYFGPYFLLPKAFKWGGSLISQAANGIQQGMKPVRDFGNKEIKDMGQRYQGKYGKAYNPDDGRFRRGLNRFRSGHFLPTERSRALTTSKGDTWQEEQDKLALSYLKRAGEKAMQIPEGYETFVRDAEGNMLDKSGRITTDEALADKTYLKGVAAMKQRWVDLMDDDDASAAVKKMAARQLSATASWPELQGNFTKKGRRVIDTEAWAPSITTSPEDYPRVLRSRVDGAPHVVDAGARNAAKIDPKYATEDSIEARNIRSNRRILYSIKDQMSNEDFSTQSDGFWQEAARVASLKDAAGNFTPQALEVQQALQDRFAAINAAGPTVRQQMLGHLANGGELEQNVNIALGVTPGTTGRVAARGAPRVTVQDFMHD